MGLRLFAMFFRGLLVTKLGKGNSDAFLETSSSDFLSVICFCSAHSIWPMSHSNQFFQFQTYFLGKQYF